jgi:nitrile hydratase accessory protein
LKTPEARPFEEPWQAQVFAMAVLLDQRGLFGWEEWTTALGVEIVAGAGEPGHANYFGDWLSALEKLLFAKNVANEGEIVALAEAWRAAAAATPHGRPVLLDAGRREG